VARLWRNEKIYPDGTFDYDWECPEVKGTVQDTIDFLTKGCSCKKNYVPQRDVAAGRTCTACM
jgi:hypothetical protein